jgi:hypothetical protein
LGGGVLGNFQVFESYIKDDVGIQYKGKYVHIGPSRYIKNLIPLKPRNHTLRTRVD